MQVKWFHEISPFFVKVSRAATVLLKRILKNFPSLIWRNIFWWGFMSHFSIHTLFFCWKKKKKSFFPWKHWKVDFTNFLSKDMKEKSCNFHTFSALEEKHSLNRNPFRIWFIIERVAFTEFLLRLHYFIKSKVFPVSLFFI